MADAIVTMTGQEKQVLSTLQAIERAFNKVGEAQARAEEKSKEANKTAESGFQSMISGATRAAVAMSGIGSAAAAVSAAVRMAKADFEHLNQQAERSRNTTLSLADKQLNAMFAFSGDSSVPDRAAADRMMREVGRNSNVPMADVYPVMEAVIGAKGQLNNAQAIGTGQTVIDFSKTLNPPTKALMAGAITDLRNTYGWDAETAGGMFLQGGIGHRNTDPAAYAQHVIPSIKSLGNMGYEGPTAMALTTAMSLTTGDFKARESSTASTNFGKQVFEETARFKELEGADLPARLKFLQTDPRGQAVRNQMVGVLGAEARAKGYMGKAGISMEADSLMAAVQMLEGKGEGHNQLMTALANAPSADKAKGVWNRTRGEFSELDFQKIAVADKEREAELERKQTVPGRAAAGVSIKSFEDTLTETAGVNGFDRFEAQTGRWFRQSVRGQSESEASAQTLELLAARKGKIAESTGDPVMAAAAKDIAAAATDIRLAAERMATGPTPNGPPPLTSGVK